MESDVSLSFSSSPPPHPCLLSSRCDASPAAHPLSRRLIHDSLNKTQIKTDNEESFPLAATFICCDCYSEVCPHACVCFQSGNGSRLALSPASLVVEENSHVHAWPSVLCVCLVCALWGFRAKCCFCSCAELVWCEYPSCDFVFHPLAWRNQRHSNVIQCV